MIAYFDCSSGISGDMLLGALVDAGMPLKELEKGLSRLPLKGYKLSVKTVKRAGFLATKVDVVQSSKLKVQSSKKWRDIEKIIKTSTLSDEIKQKGLHIFKRLFKVEAKVHGERSDKVHLHELGAVDCIIDIFGVLIGFDILGIEKVYASPLNLGGGTVKTEHGILPVPAPATLELLRDIPVYSSDINCELTTPTGAALISTLAQDFGPMPEMQISKIGVGAGNKDFKEQSNVLRIFIGQNPEPRVTVIETNIDDMNPQVYEYVMEKLFKAGALDVFLTQIIMKKGRPGIKLTVLCNGDKRDRLIKIILQETTSIGLRFYEAQRKTLHRQSKYRKTRYGRIRVKISRLGKEIIKVIPEYEDCKKIAKKFNIPLLKVIKEVASREIYFSRSNRYKD